jgi:molecular chaperone HscC
MIIGIDLGTTNSLVAVWQDGEPRLIPNALGQFLTPSAVGFDEKNQILTGAAARDRLLTHPDLTAANFKRYMGTDREIPLGARYFRPEELSAFVLKSLKADAEAFLKTTIEEAVITVPAYFNDRQRKATRIAGQLAGLHVERLLNEPTAAALAYGIHQRDSETRFLVFDLGGGTFDVSILEIFSGVIEVRSTAGDNFLGGEDFVDALCGGFIRYAAAQGISEEQFHGKLEAALRIEAERAKRGLSESESSAMTLRIDDRAIEWKVTEDDLARLAAPLLERLTAPVERALRDSRIRAPELSEILLVGGATRMPVVRKLVARMFGRFPSTQLSPDEAIALGAAVQAGLKARDHALSEVVITDVCPYSLGIEVSNRRGEQVDPGHYLPILERNVVIPASRVERVYTLLDGQRDVRLPIYQGEARRVKDNVFLGAISMTVPPAPAGDQSIDVRFTYDINGLLEIEATVVGTGAMKRLVIEGCPGVLTAEQIDKRLRALAAFKIHPREQAENRAVMARAERLFEQLLAEERTYLGEQIRTFEQIMNRQQPTLVERARAELVQVLDRLDRHSYL